MTFFKKISSRLFALIYPIKCPYCHRLMNPKDCACEKCAEKLPQTAYDRFAVGGIPCVAALPYTGEYAEAVKYFKFGKRAEYSLPFAMLLVQRINAFYEDMDFDFVAAVPMYKRIKRKKHFDHAERLAKMCAELMNIPYKPVLEKHKQGVPQHTLKRSEREKNVKGMFRVKDKEAVQGSHVLLIDDIITTGNTLGECAKVLKKGGCRRVSCAALSTVMV